jgi:hypothetical protein
MASAPLRKVPGSGMSQLTIVPDQWTGRIYVPPDLRGSQEPRFWTAPPRHRDKDPNCKACDNRGYSTGCGDYQSADVLEWAAAYEYELDQWQSWWLTELCGTRPDGSWSAFEGMLIVSRQNGKNQCLEVRELGGLFILGEKMLIHTAHEFKAAAEHFRRVRDMVTNFDDLRRRVKSVTTSHGDEAIELKPAPTLIFGAQGRRVRKTISPRLRFLARSRGSGRSFTADFLAYDEAMILSDEVVGASMPTMSAVANPQMVYTASAGYQDSVQLGSVRRRVIRKDPSLMGAEWSINPHNDMCHRDEVMGRKTNRYIVCNRHDDRDNPKSWARANPALVNRISPHHVAQEMASMSAATFDRERLGVGDWPSEDAAWAVVSEEQWQNCGMPDPGGATRPVTFAFDIDPDMISATVSACWERPGDGTWPSRPVVETPRGCSREGTAWVIPKLVELRRKWHPLTIVAPKNGPAAGLVDEALNAGLDITWASSADEAAAFSLIVTSVRKGRNGGLIHLGREHAPGLWASVASAETRDVGDGGRAWCRRDSESDITPITSSTLALWALNKRRRNYNPVKSVAAPGRQGGNWMTGA